MAVGKEPTAAGRFPNCKPVDMPPNSSLRVTAMGPILVCRADRDRIDFLISWTTLIDNVHPGDEPIRSRLAEMNNPTLLMHLPFENVIEAFRRMEAVQVPAGEDVVRQGQPGDRFHLIESGRTEVWQQGLYDDAPKKVADLKPGDHFGEEALVAGGTRNATVRMTESGRLLSLKKEDFLELISRELIQEVTPIVAEALIESGYRVVDVRYAEEYEDGHLPEAALIPLPDLRRRLTALDPRSKYITYCLSGKRSSVGAMIMRERGFDAVTLRNGLRDWPRELVVG